MAQNSIEIVCTACGQEALLRREPVYEGFRRVGEQLICSGCGHVYEDEASVPFKTRKMTSIFGEQDRPVTADIFGDDERHKNCRYCKHYVVNPFTQRCGLHDKEVQATDICFDFEEAEEEQADES